MSKLTLFARESAARSLAILARLFVFQAMEARLRGVSKRERFIGVIVAVFSLSMAVTQRAAAERVRKPLQVSASQVVTDETGRRVAVPSTVNRIVSLAPNLTETIYALGMEEKLAGDTDYCDTPPAAKRKPHVGTMLNPSLEAIVALHPDLVLAAANSANRRETVDALARLGVAVYATDPRTVRGMFESIEHVANLIGATQQGAALIVRLQARVDALQARLADVPPAHVLFVVWDDPLITIGQNTFIADALRWCGAESVVIAKQDWPQLSFEEVLRLQPEYVIFTNNHSESSATQLSELRSRPVWKQLRAVELGRVINASEEIDRPAPGLIDAIEQLAHKLHPEAFPGENAGAMNRASSDIASDIRSDVREENHSCAR
jgi:iron complex transport system substrate-binding protein